MRQTIMRLACLLLLPVVVLTARADNLDEETQRLIDEKVEEKWQRYIESEAFDQRVEEVILQFIEKQNQARRERQQAAAKAAGLKVAEVDPDNDYIRGDADAAFSLIEYSDFECPYCKRFHPTAGKFIERNPEVNWVYRHFPLNFHNPGAQREAEAAECAGELGGNDMFWAFTDKIYERTRSNGKGFPIDKLEPLAVELGLDQQQFAECFNSRRHKSRVLAQFRNGQAAGVTGTPGNFLRHNPSGMIISVTGAQPLERLEQALEQLKQRVPE